MTNVKNSDAGFKHVTIVGCGLLGGSFALALRRSGFTGRITACGGKRSPQLAVERGVADALETSFDTNQPCEADLVFLAAPISGILDFLKTKGHLLKAGALVTDAGSTKAEICRAAQIALPAHVAFIGGHPMAGKEHTGVEYSDAHLFERATWALMEEHRATDEQFKRLRNLIVSFGARALVTTPERHDAAVALISHLPQLVASTLAILLDGKHDGSVAERALAQQLTATGWRDMTRLAGSSFSVWRDIVMTNQPNVTQALSLLIAELQNLQEALAQRDYNAVQDLFKAANRSVEEHRAIRLNAFEKL
ncbi:MAG: prephenate dehydrogenase/arogenate dehydrogenase family protein [Acidobacteria bacterium]|nr:prephenate dehydrogenase/arogenate dehydrogenase family protein [Acidobacteriota bacterium]